MSQTVTIQSDMITQVRVTNFYATTPGRDAREALEHAGYTVLDEPGGGFCAVIEAVVAHDGTEDGFRDAAWPVTGIGDVLEAAGLGDAIELEQSLYEVADLEGDFGTVEFDG